jgi:hypothetical protein
MTDQKPIPDEIMREAREVYYQQTMRDPANAIKLIARALMARDERAAKIAWRMMQNVHVTNDDVHAAILTYGDKP